MLKPLTTALLLGFPAAGAWAVPASLPLVLPLRCEGPATLGCVLGTSGTPGPVAGHRMLSEPFWLELNVPEPAQWRGFSFSLPLNADRTGVRVRAGDRVFFNRPSRLNEDQYFDCQPVRPLTPGTVRAECRPLTFVDQVLPECVKPEGHSGLLCLAGWPLALRRGALI